MRELHVVGTDADGALLLGESPGGRASYRVDDARVVPTPKEHDVRRPPSPAEIQAHLRRGMSPEAISRQTGTDVQRVVRWAAPVQAEMADVLRGAHDTHVTNGDRCSPEPLGELVAAATKDVEDDVEWRATRRADGRWRVLLQLQGEAGTRTASWIWDQRDRTLEAASARARRLSFPG